MRYSRYLSRAAVLSILSIVVLLSACTSLAAPEITAVTPLPEGAQLATATPVTAAPTLAPETDAAPTATPTPLTIDLPQGSAAAIAMATDTAMKPEITHPLAFDQKPVPITFDEFYSGFSIRGGLKLSDKLLSLDSQEVVMEGYMAPPLKPQLDWFVLTRIRLEFCPFCSSTADWPNDIAVVYLTEKTTVATQEPIRARGRMEVGSAVDPETGMVSLVRIYAENVESLAAGPAPAFASQKVRIP
ncbi:MAG: hypothetical protein R3C14_03665 [Caldilineaceae bacterium]